MALRRGQTLVGHEDRVNCYHERFAPAGRHAMRRHAFYRFLGKATLPFQPRSLPLMVRPSYARELINACTFPAALALVEGAVIGLLADRVFDISDLQLATIFAAPMFANFTSFLWTALANGRRKIRFMVAIQTTMLLLIGLIGFLPANWLGGMLLVAMVVIIRCLAAGFVTLRSNVWRRNYPRHVRARITSKLILIAAVVIAISPLASYGLLEYEESAFRLLYPMVVLLAGIGAAAMSGVRLRGERELLTYESRPRPSHTAPPPSSKSENTDNADPAATDHALAGRGKPASRFAFVRVLKDDHLFRQYMIWQFITGLANLTGEVALGTYIIKQTKDQSFEFVTSISLTTTIPWLFAVATLPLWARYLDRVHIAKFRSRHGMLWVFAQGGYWLAAMSGIIWLLAIPRIIQGVARGGGMLAWNLGHNDFADRRLVAVYMGIHVTLTGVRGFIAAYLGVFLLAGFQPRHVLGLSLPGFEGIGIHVFLFTAFFAGVSYLGFVRLYRHMKRLGQIEPVTD